MKGNSIVPDERQDAGVHYETFGPQNLIVLNDAVMDANECMPKTCLPFGKFSQFSFLVHGTCFPVRCGSRFLESYSPESRKRPIFEFVQAKKDSQASGFRYLCTQRQPVPERRWE